jgi:hypothetical protein
MAAKESARVAALSCFKKNLKKPVAKLDRVGSLVQMGAQIQNKI